MVRTWTPLAKERRNNIQSFDDSFNSIGEVGTSVRAEIFKVASLTSSAVTVAVLFCPRG